MIYPHYPKILSFSPVVYAVGSGRKCPELSVYMSDVTSVCLVKTLNRMHYSDLDLSWEFPELLHCGGMPQKGHLKHPKETPCFSCGEELGFK